LITCSTEMYDAEKNHGGLAKREWSRFAASDMSGSAGRRPCDRQFERACQRSGVDVHIGLGV